MLTIRVEAKELNKHIKHVESFRQGLENLQEPLKKAKRRQMNRWAKNFTTEGSIYGGWAALSPRWTIPEREEEGYGAGPKLIRQGTLLAHFVEQNEAGEVTNQAVEWNMSNKGNTRGYAAATVSMHTGYPNPLNAYYGNRNYADVPARKLWDINPEDEKAIAQILEDYIEDIIKKYFGGG